MKKTYIVGVIISVMLLAACSNNVKPDTNNEVVTPLPTQTGFEYISAADSPVSDVHKQRKNRLDRSGRSSELCM